jgi:phage tail-like protein
MDFYNWMKSTLPKSDGGDGAWRNARKDGSIVGYDSEDQEVTRWNITKAWIKSYQLADLATDKSDLVVEKYEIVCEQMNRVK